LAASLKKLSRNQPSKIMSEFFTRKSSDTWLRFAKEINGIFIEGKSWESDKVISQYKNFDILFDNYTLWSGKYNQIYTRIIVPFYSETDFEFEIYRGDIMTWLEFFFGSQDIKIGRPEFDKQFVVKSNSELKIKTLLQNQKIRTFIQSQKKGNLEISKCNGIWKPKIVKNNFQLSFFIEGELIDFEKLKTFQSFFVELIDQLSKMDLIFPKPAANSDFEQVGF
jgi:hypothetical protein